ncbi:hypothetical protein A0O34_06335 [Chryseobacterium glaciei]|uniref:Lipoprotein n=1 Tax=Chryseobacterium glaciei TaxID=1685010 RepID=A0A172XTD9_9FLAO|nr:hypothetical protein [Chryseobacterium glaciei]ANF50150.1 hypothetical protein A0O34_06335 [Chryseobacterium glaciei]
MKKQLLVLSSLLLISCGGSDFLNSQEEVQTPKVLDKNSLIQSKTSSITNKTETVLMNLSFDTGVRSENGGCSFEYILGPPGHENTHTSTQCFGPNPISQNGYLVRGYGKPRRSAFNYDDWFGVMLISKNEGKMTNLQGQSVLVDNPLSNAISIQQHFQANQTYEITLSTIIEDQIYTSKHSQYSSNTYSIDKSEAFPTLAIELKDTPEISGTDPCAARPNVGNGLTQANNYKKQTVEKTSQWAKENKTFVFNFSTKEEKNGLVIYFLPEVSGQRPAQHVPESYFRMDIRNVKVIQKPFDPIYVVPDTRPNTNPCGFRGGC